MFLLLLGYQHYDSGWTFIDIGPVQCIDSMEIMFTFHKQLVHGLLNLRRDNKKTSESKCFSSEEQVRKISPVAPDGIHIIIL